MIKFLTEKLELTSIVDIPVFTSRSNVEDWDAAFLLISDPKIRVNEGIKRCEITIRIQCEDKNDYEAIKNYLIDIFNKLDNNPIMTSFSPTSGQLYVGYILNEIDPEECEHKSVSSDYQVWPPPRWECDDCGETIYCECWESFIEKTTQKDISSLNFKSNLCWKCKGEDPPTGGGYRYAGKFRRRHWQEVLYEYKNLVLTGEEEELWKKAENKVRRRHNVPEIGKKYVSETDLYSIISESLPDHEVIHHFRPDWLEGQEIDIFLPKFGVGVEYMGRQHFEPVDYFGGEEALEDQKKRDERKKVLCEENDVKLFYVNYDDDLEEKAKAIVEIIKEEN